MDSPAAIVQDVSGGGHSGTGSGLAGLPGKVRGAVRFDDAGSHVEVADRLGLSALPPAFTVDLWIRPAAGARAEGTLLHFGSFDESGPLGLGGDGFHLHLRRDGHLLVVAAGVQRDLTEEAERQAPGNAFHLEAGRWSFVAVVVDTIRGRIRLRIDERESAPMPLPKTSGSTVDGPLWIGGIAAVADPRWSFAGDLDEVEFYERDLSSEHLEEIWQAGSNGKCR